MAAPCPLCGHDVDWLTASAVAQLLGVTPGRIRQYIAAGAFPNAVKYRPAGGIAPLWRLPIADVLALKEARDGA